MSRTNRCDQILPADFDQPGTLEPVLCHVVSRCVRGIRLLGDRGVEGCLPCPREACSDRLAMLAGSYAVKVVGHAFMENHLHGLLRLDPQLASLWLPIEVVHRWFAAHPDRSLTRKSERERAAACVILAADDAWVKEHRARLCSVSWFMKAWKQSLAIWINKRDQQGGTVFQERFGLTVVADEAAAVAVLAYIDLNPFAAGLGVEPADGCFTSLEARVESHREELQGVGQVRGGPQVRKQDAKQRETRRLRVVGVRRWQGQVKFGAGCDRRADGTASLRANLKAGPLKLWLSFGDYLRFLERYAQKVREGKRRLTGDLRTALATLAEELDVLHPPVWPPVPG